MTALLAKYGEKWVESIPKEISDELKSRRGSLKGRILLDVENNSNILWLSTLEELRKICLNSEIWPIVRKITSFNETEFTEKLNFLREIRNIIGHNRAVTEQTKKICAGIVDYFRSGVNVFRIKMGLFSGLQPGDDQVKCEWSYPEAEDGEQLRCHMFEQNIPENSHVDLTESDYFRDISSTSLLTKRKHPWVDIAEVLATFRELESYILAITICLEGDIWGVIWPRSISIERQREIIKKFVSSESLVWSETPYEKQSSKFLGDPKIWFYRVYGPKEMWPEPDGTPREEIPHSENIIPFPKSS